MEQGKRTPGGERHSLVSTSSPTANSGTGHHHLHHLQQHGSNGSTAAASRRTSVPLLDEDSLKANTSGAFSLMMHGDDAMKSGAAIPGSPPSQHRPMDSAQLYAMLQQQQAVAMAAAQLEHTYNQTCYMLQQCSHNALLTVVMSLLNDYPTTMLQPIRVRLEQVLAHQMSPSASGRVAPAGRKMSEFVPSSSAAPWTPSSMRGGGGGGSTAPTPTMNSTSPSHRRGRGHKGKEEEQEMCSIHNNMRAMKHLQLNPSTGLHECVHGFHCLVDGPPDASPRRASTLSTMSPSASVSRTNGVAPSGDAAPFQPPPSSTAAAARAAAPGAAADSLFSVSEVEALRMLGCTLQNASPGQPQPHRAGAAAAQPGPHAFANTPLRMAGLGLSAPGHHDPESLQQANGGGSGGFTVVGGDRSSAGTSPLDLRLNMDIPSLEYLLQSVRDIDDD
ncbi:hypothetical protein NESM_000612900 [Novymonas esmeraldas]|uniref:Uncharacterized protein n=1 Tax=Novymonas esmeraldas TaxID=1808958 RepID=A0AAW0ET91_9TRYP